jgi:hypothetical protein
MFSSPDGFGEMSIDEQRRAMNTFRLEEANPYHTAVTGIHNHQHIDALRMPYLGL